MSRTVDVDKKPLTTLQIWVSFFWGDFTNHLWKCVREVVGVGVCTWARARVCLCVCVCVYVRAQGVHVFDNNKASENEEELNCVSHFSFPCSGACQKEKSPAFWMMAQTTKSEQQTPRLWGERWRKRKYGEKKEGGGGKERKRKKEKERRVQTSVTNTVFRKWPNQQTNKAKSRHQCLHNMAEHALKVKHNGGGKKKSPIQLALVQFWKDLSRGWFNVRASIL